MLVANSTVSRGWFSRIIGDTFLFRSDSKPFFQFVSGPEDQIVKCFPRKKLNHCAILNYFSSNLGYDFETRRVKYNVTFKCQLISKFIYWKVIGTDTFINTLLSVHVLNFQIMFKIVSPIFKYKLKIIVPLIICSNVFQLSEDEKSLNAF